MLGERGAHIGQRTQIELGRHMIGNVCGHSLARVRVFTAVLVVLSCVSLVFVVAPAGAVRGHVFAGAVNGEGGSGPLERFVRPVAVAVNEASGDVYVLDSSKDRVQWFDAAGTVFEGSFNGSATPAHIFSEPSAIAIDNACHLREARTHEALTQAACEKLDFSNGDVYVVDEGHHAIDKFTAAGGYVGQLTGVCPKLGVACKETEIIPFTQIDGVAVDASGGLWVEASRSGSEVKIYSFNDRVANVELAEVAIPVEPGALVRPGLAVDARGDLYVGFESPAGSLQHPSEYEDFVSELSGSGALLRARAGSEPFALRAGGTPQPGVAGEVAGQGGVYVEDGTVVHRSGPEGEAIERLGEGRLSSSGGVAVNVADGYVYAADPAADKVAVFAPEPPGAPGVLGESLGGVSADSALAQAEVDPRGAASSYRVEYGRCASLASCPQSGYEQSAPAPGEEDHTGADFEVRDLGVNLTGLAAGAAYHFRFVVGNEAGGEPRTVTGPEQTFATEPAGGEAALPDGREWELVSPPPAQKHGAAVLSSGIVQAAASGDAISYLASAPFEAEPEGFTGNGAQILSTRGSGGWGSRTIAIAHQDATGYAPGASEYRVFSSDLSLALVQPFGAFAPLSGQASEQTPYERTDYAASGEPCTSDCYLPLVDGGDVPSGTAFGGDLEGRCAEAGQLACGPKVRGATPDLSHVVLSSPVALAEGVPAGEGLYEWGNGRLSFLGLAGEAPALAFHAISADGSRVVFSGSSGGLSGLLLRDTAGETVQLDAAQAGCGGCASGGGKFQAASADGSKVFFTDEHPLAVGSGGALNAKGRPEEDLYVCEAPLGTGKLGCVPHDLTPLGAGSEQAGVLGVLGVSEDGSYVYFAANGVLTGEADSAGEHAVQGSCLAASAPAQPVRCNLYALHDGVSGWEAPRLVAVLSSADQPDWSSVLEGHTARTSPDGEWLAFMSERSLTGYDNEDQSSAWPGQKLDEEVYLYHAGGSVVCASCDPTGARPAGVEYSRLETRHGGLAGGEGVWPSSAWIAGSVPGWESYEPGAALYQPRYLSDGGRLFFDSSDGLEAHDANGVGDVYEYEPAGYRNGEGSEECVSASPTFGERSDGCVSLISGASSAGESAFLDASENGGDVFFLTPAELVGQDTDSALDVYDAHECTGSAPCFASSSQRPGTCLGEASCKAPAGSQPGVYGAPASASFSGPGNASPVSPSPAGGVLAVKEVKKPVTRSRELAQALTRCRRDRKRAQRTKCEQAAHARYGAKTQTKKQTKKPGPEGRS